MILRLMNDLLYVCLAGADDELNAVNSSMILRGDSKLASAALKLARLVRTSGLRPGLRSQEHVELALELVEFANSACESPLINPTNSHSDHNFQDPGKYPESLVMVARDVDAHPWGAFGFVHPNKYLPFLQQLAGDLMMDTQSEMNDDKSTSEDQSSK